MAVLSDYTSGTISLAQGSVTVTGTGTLFEVTRFREGDTLQIQNLTAIIASVNSDTSLTLTAPWTGTTIVDGPYRARQLGDISRYPTQAATIIDLLGNGVLTNIAELGVEEGKTPVGGPSGEYVLVNTNEFGVKDPNGSLAELAALTLSQNKFFRTDASGGVTLGQIADAASSMLSLDGKAYGLPYYSGTTTALLADIRCLYSYNWIINGDFSVNQRVGVKKPANGVYGYDRWKGHTNGIEQVVEAFPGGECTLNWSGGGNGSLGANNGPSPIRATVSPGNLSIVVPQTATNVSLVSGDARDRNLWSPRPPGLEFFLCQRYYQRVSQVEFQAAPVSGYSLRCTTLLPVPMRVSPAISFTPVSGSGHAVSSSSIADRLYMAAFPDSQGVISVSQIKLDAEI